MQHRLLHIVDVRVMRRHTADRAGWDLPAAAMPPTKQTSRLHTPSEAPPQLSHAVYSHHVTSVTMLLISDHPIHHDSRLICQKQRQAERCRYVATSTTRPTGLLPTAQHGLGWV